jgi:alanine racemase
MSKLPDPIDITIDLDRIRANAVAIKRQTGTPLIAVVKADAYGLGAKAVVNALDGVADEFACFSLDEAREIRRPGLVLGPLSGPAADHAALKIRPAVSSLAEARRVGRIPSALNVDTGMQWLGCTPDEVGPILRTCNIVEAYTHTLTLAGVRKLITLCRNRVPRLHAAATRLLKQPAAWLDAVRPGLALYRGALTVSTRLAVVRDLDGPAGYHHVRARRVGVILCGYARGFLPGIVQVNGRRRRVLEVGMNTSLVEIGPRDSVGDPVVLLDRGLTEATVARTVGRPPQEVLCRYARLGPRRYVGLR